MPTSALCPSPRGPGSLLPRRALALRALAPSALALWAAGAAAAAMPAVAQTTASPARAEARELLRQLVEVPTTDDRALTRQAAQLMADRLVSAGFPRTDVRVLGPDRKVGHLVARYPGRDRAAKPLLLMAHIDVVPAERSDWSVDPWKLLERDGWFYGRGTSDNKAGAAMLVANFMRLHREGWQPRRDVIIVLTGDEETEQAGMPWLLAQSRDLREAALALNTDSGGVLLRNGQPVLFAVQASEKVYTDLVLEVTDVGGHSSLARPDNPIYTVAAALDRIAAHRFPLHVTDVARAYFARAATVESGQLAADMRAVAQPTPGAAAADRLSKSPFYNARLRTTCVATRMNAGHADNALPQLARANINCRILPGEPIADVQATIRRLAGPRVKVTVKTEGVTSPPSAVSPEMLARIERLVAAQWQGIPVVPVMEAGATDGMFTRRAGIPTYALSAVLSDENDVRAHGRDERIGVEAFYQATAFWYRLIKEFGDRP